MSLPAPDDGLSESAASDGGAGEDGYDKLRALLVGPEELQIRKLQQRLDDPGRRAEEISAVLAEAFHIRAGRDHQLRKALQPTVEEAIITSVRRDPRVLTDSLFPIIGRTIRRALAASLEGMVESLNSTLEQSISLRGLGWRIDALRSGKSFAEIALLRSLRYRVEQVFLIHKETGLLLCHEVADAAVVKDADMVSGMLTAIQDFVRDSFASVAADEVESMQVGEVNVLIQHGPSALLACVIRGVAPRGLRAVFQNALEHVHQDHGTDLQQFQGDTAPFQASSPHLKTCLLGLMPAERRSSFRYAWAAVAIVFLVAAGWVVMSVQAQRRWNVFLEKLREQPGIVVTAAESNRGRYVVAGLRDPLSSDPTLALAEVGIPNDAVTFRWTPYLSVDPAFSGVREYDGRKQTVEQSRLFFKTGSAEVTPDAALTAARGIRDLLGSAERIGRKVRIEIAGHCDPQGTESLNAKLSQQRADQVLQYLVQLGIPSDSLAATGRGTSEPLSPFPSTLELWVERSVSFRVIGSQP